MKNSTLLKTLLRLHTPASLQQKSEPPLPLPLPPQVFLRPPLTLFSVSGVFALLQAYAFLQYLKDRLTRQEFQTLFFLGVSLAAGIVFLTVIYLTYTGRLAPLPPAGRGFPLL